MRALLDFLVKYYHWLIFIALEGISLVLLFQFNHYQNSVWLTTANTVVGRINDWEQQALRYMTLGEVNEALTQRNLLLEQNNRALAQHINELSHDSTRSERLQADRLEGIKLIPARITTNSVMRRDNLMTINVGEADGVLPEMGVVSGTGIVGIVFMTSPHYSIVLPLLNSRSNISCRLRHRRDQRFQLRLPGWTLRRQGQDHREQRRRPQLQAARAAQHRLRTSAGCMRRSTEVPG